MMNKGDEKMKNETTEMVLILDRSGSMTGLESDTIGGFNSMIAKQKALEGSCRVTTVLFDNIYELLHDRIDIQGVNPITTKEYFTRGSTALLDAIGFSIQKIKNVQDRSADGFQAEKVIFVIITDGMENASREYTLAKVQSLIEEQKNKHNWEFIFIGANIDAIQTASQFGISANRAVNYVPDSHGTQMNFMSMHQAVANFRNFGKVNDSDLDEIRKDHNKRGKK